MGFISELSKQRSSRALWDRAFGTNKEEGNREEVQRRDTPSSFSGTDAALARLLQTMRTRVPGGWSDDRMEQSRHFVGIPYIAIHRIGMQLFQAEFQAFKKDRHHPDGKRPLTEEDPEYDLVRLLERPNKNDSFGMYMYRLNQQLSLTGTALNWMVPNMLGDKIVELYCVPTALAIPMAVQSQEYPEGAYQIQPIYPYGPFSSYPVPMSSAGAKIPAQWITPVRYPHPLLWYDGYSPLTALRLQLDEIESIDRSRWYSMYRGINPSAVLNFEANKDLMVNPLPESEINRIRADFMADHQGPENLGKLMVSTPGAKLEPWGQTPDKMMYESGWDQLTNFAMGALGITKPAAGMVEGSSYATLFAALKQLNTLTLEPICSLVAGVWNRTIVPFFGEDLLIEIRCRRIDDHDVNFTKVDKLTSLKGMPESVIKYACHIMDLDVDEEMVKDLSKAGEQPGMGAPGMAPGGSGAPEPPPLPGIEGEDSDAQEISNGAPTPGGLNLGSLGPKDQLHNQQQNGKHLNGYHRNGKAKKAPMKDLAELYGHVRVKQLPDRFMSNQLQTGPSPVVNVQVDQPSAPNVNVQIVMPEQAQQPAPVVNNILPPRMSRKTIEYNEHGFPAAITEREVHEESHTG